MVTLPVFAVFPVLDEVGDSALPLSVALPDVPMDALTEPVALADT